MNYLEIPVNFLYKVDAGNGKVLLGGGPYLGYALSGKHADISTDTLGNNSGTTSNLSFGTAGLLKRTDFGLNFVAGYQLNQGLMFKLGYGLGLTNLETSSGVSNKNRVTSISVGYFFK